MVRHSPLIAADAEPLHTVAVCQSFPCDQTLRLVKLDSPQVVHWLPFSKQVVDLVSPDLPGLLGTAWRHDRKFVVFCLPGDMWDPKKSARLQVRADRVCPLPQGVVWRLQEATRLHGTCRRSGLIKFQSCTRIAAEAVFGSPDRW